ncbi:GH11619 [Drosophila grimshawi]|uniref:GH11619 n=1 Tax=Drosophila grimshawi TaxID=7222 RepID=B4JC09_DROGR|nr:GH11619 [Drosophila grimshawi]
MVSHYYNMPYSQKHSANLAYASATQPWNWPSNYHTPPNHQFIGDVDSSHAAAHHAAAAHPMYYNAHMFHSAASDWHSPASNSAAAAAAAAAAANDNFVQQQQQQQNNGVPTTAHQLMHQHQHQHHAHLNGGGGGGGSSSSASSGSSSSAPVVGSTQLNESSDPVAIAQAHQQQQHQQQQQQQQHIAEGLPSPPITVSGSEISSPGAPTSASSPHHLSHHLSNNNNNSPSTHNNNNNSITANNNNHAHRTSPPKTQFYDWMKKPTYSAQPQPEKNMCNMPEGKTRTKDKYRVVYTDFQRLELEKEYCTSRYITIRRKSELAQSLSLSERQVKIWFQNRRAKERKQNKKGSDPNVMGGGGVGGIHHQTEYSQLLDAKTKLEPGLHLQHTLHSMNPMAAMNLPAMRLHPHLTAHSHSLVAAAAHSHQLQQQQMSAAAVGVGTLSM